MELDIENYQKSLKRAADFRKSVFDRMEGKSPGIFWSKGSLRKVKKVIFINSSSRSGSSILFSLLKKTPGIYSLSGEGVPFYKLNGFSPERFSSDEIPKDTEVKPDVYSDLSRDFLSDLSLASQPNNILKDSVLLEEYIDDLLLRLPMQWPQIDFSYDRLKKLAGRAFILCKNNHKYFCKEEFYLELLSLLRQEYKAINPYYYDIPGRMIKKMFPALKIPSGPPNNTLTIEEAPFILLTPVKKVTENELAQGTLLLKSSVDCYRMEFLESIFSEAKIKIIQLVRNPLGCVNGLLDGWLHRGFFSHNLKPFFSRGDSGVKMLKIAGYSELSAWGKYWWNYDLPPGWKDYIAKPLEEVCAFQWYSSNRAILEYLSSRKEDYCLARYENIMQGLASRKQEMEKIMDFIGASRTCIDQFKLDNLPVVQATEQPRPFRWRNRKEQLLPLIEKKPVREMSLRLGYDCDQTGGWF